MEIYWWGIIFLILIIIGIIITIVILNRQNTTVDLIKSLPSYQIYYPKGDTYLSINNIQTQGTFQAICNTQFTFWTPIVTLTKNANINQWSFIKPTTTTFDQALPTNSTIYYLINTNFNNLNNNDGYMQISNAIAIPPLKQILYRLYPISSKKDALEFIYTSTGVNMFTLKSASKSYPNYFVSVDDGGNPFWTSDSRIYEIAEFQLTQIKS